MPPPLATAASRASASAWLADRTAKGRNGQEAPARDFSAAATAGEASQEDAEAALLSPFLRQDAEGRIQGPVSEIRRTILSLSKNGLSVAEIESVTGQPRHIITAALNHG